uniref:Uncharacterized protein n=1 Tax=Glossina brevipalpis TaxID=37001 RepID=A0A1A9WYY1_9MUSC
MNISVVIVQNAACNPNSTLAFDDGFFVVVKSIVYLYAAAAAASRVTASPPSNGKPRSMFIAFYYYFSYVATMMSCPLPMPLPIIPSLHEFSPVHIGVKLTSCYPFQKYFFMLSLEDDFTI